MLSNGSRNKPTYECDTCGDDRYVIGYHRDHAVARRCPSCMSVCPQCNGEGFLFNTRKKGYQSVSPCPECTNLDRRIDLFNDARLPARYHSKNMFDFETQREGQKLGNLEEIKVKLYNYAGRFMPGENGLLLSGRVGTGKTHLLAVLVGYFAIEKGIHCRFVEFTHLLGELREAYERRGNATEILNRLSDVPVLAIDELGKGRKNDWQLSIIDELISKRYNRCLSTFFTTNYDLRERPKLKPRGMVDSHDPDFRNAFEVETLVDRVGRRIVSRLFEMTEVVEFKEVPDYRRPEGLSP